MPGSEAFRCYGAGLLPFTILLERNFYIKLLGQADLPGGIGWGRGPQNV